MRWIGRRLTYANVLSTAAIFAVLGGGAFAAARIGPRDIRKNAIRARHVKRHQIHSRHLDQGAVRSRQIADGSLRPRDFPGGEVPLPTTLPSGRTLTGTFDLRGFVSESGEGVNLYGSDDISFAVPLARAPSVRVVGEGGPPTDTCPGSPAAPAAAPGDLCVYFRHVNLLADPGEILVFDPGGDDSGDVDDAGRYGAIVTIGAKDSAGGGPVIANGTWAVTAP